MNMITDDEQFAALFKESIASDYKDALLFMNVNPDISLMKFRKILESLCSLYAEHYNYKFDNNNLHKQINELAGECFICGVNKESFHDVRILTNGGVHIENKGSYKSDEIVSKDVLIKNAVESRKGVLNLLEHAFLELNIGKEVPKYEIKLAGGQEYKDLWYNCLHSSDYKAHFRLGIMYQALAQGYERLALDDESFSTWPSSKFVFAAECYKSAFQFCSGKGVDSIIETEGKGISITSASYESLFSYALLCLNGKVETNSKTDAQIILHALINRGFIDAYSYLGWSYYLNGDYKKAHKYLTHSKINLNVFTFHKLGVLYLEGRACSINITLGIDCLNKAADLGCANSMFELGRLYQKGELVKQDDVLAQEYLQKSIVRGSREAIDFFDDNYLKIRSSVLNIAEQIQSMLNQKTVQVIKTPCTALIKTGRNESCPCGSGFKYKKCCGGHKVSSTNLFI